MGEVTSVCAGLSLLRRRSFLVGAVALACAPFAAMPARAGSFSTTWNGSTGDWFDAAKWSAGVPLNTATDSYKPTINTGTVTLTTNVTTSGFVLGSTALFTLTSNNTCSVLPSVSGNSSINGRIVLETGVLLDVADANVINSGTISGSGTYRQIARTLTVNGATISNLYLDANATLNGLGILTVTDTADLRGRSMSLGMLQVLPQASVSISSTATQQTLSGAFQIQGTATVSSPRLVLQGGATNAGVLSITGAQGGTATLAAGAFNNTGTVNLVSGLLDITANSSVVSGSFTADANSSVRLAAFATVTAATFYGAGSLQFRTTAVSLSGNSSVSNLILDANGAVTGAGTLTLTNHADILAVGASSTAALICSPAGTSVTFSAPATTQTLSGSYLLAGTTTFSGASTGTHYSAAGLVFTNNGALSVSGIAGQPTVVTMGAGTIVNNNGTINLLAGVLDLGAATGTLSGHIAIDADSKFRVTNATLSGITIDGDGTMIGAGGGSLRFTGESFVRNASLQGPSISPVIAGTSSIHYTHLLFWQAGGNSGNSIVDASATGYLSSSISVGTLTNHGTLYAGVSETGGTLISTTLGSGTVINNGVLMLEGSLTAALTNADLVTAYSGASLGTRIISGTVINSGTISGAYSFSGTVTSSGVLTPDAGAFSRTMTLTSPLVLTDGALLTSQNGRISVQAGGTLTGRSAADHVTFSTGTLYGSGTLTLNDNSSLNSVTLNGPTVLINDTAQVYVSGLAVTGGTVTIRGSVTQNPNSATVLNAPGRIFNSGSFGIAGGLTGTGTLTNNGLITILDSPLNRVVSATVVNSGTIASSLSTQTSFTSPLSNTGLLAGQLTLSGGGSSSGTLTGDTAAGGRPMTLTNNFTLTQGALITSTTGSVGSTGTLTLIGESYADHLLFKELAGSGTLHLGPGCTWIGGTFNGAGTMEIPAGGVIAMTGGTGTIGPGATLINNGSFLGTSAINSKLSIGGTLDNRSYLSMPYSGISATGKVLNSGTLDDSIGNMSIAGPLYTTGTVSVSSGTLTISGGGSGSGMFIATGAANAIGFTYPFTLDSASLAGSGSFFGTVTVLNANTVTNSKFSQVSGTGTLGVSGALTFPGTITSARVVACPGSIVSGLGGIVYLTSGGSFVNQSTMSLAGGSITSFGLSSNGAFLNAGILSITGSFAFAPYVSFSDSGTVALSSATQLTLSGGGTITGSITVDGALSTCVFDASSGKTVVLDSAVLSGGRATDGQVAFGGLVQLANISTAECASLGVSGSGTLTVSKAAGPSGASNGATLIVLPGATFSVEPLFGDGRIHSAVSGGRIINQGVATAINAQYTALSFANGGIFENAGTLAISGLFASPGFTSDGNTANAFINTGTASFTNYQYATFVPAVFNPGNMSLTMNSGTVSFTGPLYHTGTLSLSSTINPGAIGLLTIAGGGSASGFIQNVSTNTISFGDYTLDGASLAGPMTNTGTLTLRGEVHVAGFTIGGNLSGPGTLTSGGTGWTGGSIAWSNGAIGNAGGIVVASAGTRPLYAWNAGTPFTVDLALLTGLATRKELAGSSIVIATGRSAGWGYGSPSFGPTADTLTLSGGAQIHNAGRFYTYLLYPSIAAGDTNSGNAFISTGTFGRGTLGSTWFNSCTTITVPFHNAGLVDIQEGRIDFAGGYFDDNPITDNTADFTFAPGTGLQFSGGAYDFGDSPFDLGPGGLFGTGAVRGNFAVGGTISPGFSPGTLTLTGDIAMAPSATLALDLLFSDTGNQFDHLIVHGNYTAAGTLALYILSGPPDNSPFDLIVADHFTGIFDNVPDGSRLTDRTGAGSYLVTYTPTGIALSDFQAAPVPEPLTLTVLAPALLVLSMRKRKRRRIATPP